MLKLCGAAVGENCDKLVQADAEVAGYPDGGRWKKRNLAHRADGNKSRCAHASESAGFARLGQHP